MSGVSYSWLYVCNLRWYLRRYAKPFPQSDELRTISYRLPTIYTLYDWKKILTSSNNQSINKNFTVYSIALFLILRNIPQWVRAFQFTRFLSHRLRTTGGRTPVDEWSGRRRDLYLKTYNIHNRQTTMPPAGFEPTVSAGERPQTYALDRAATGTGIQ